PACGAQHSYFGKPEWEPFAPGLKTIEQAIEIRRRVLSAFENAENEIHPERQKELLTFAIVGGGAARARIVLVEAGPRILPAFPEDLAARATRDLTRMGVEVRTNSLVGLVDAS